MLWLISLLVIIGIVLLTYLFLIIKEIRNITKQLNDYNNFKTRKKLHINLINKDIELLAESINKHMEISNKLQINQIKSEEKLKNLIASISHDLRTPLTSIRGYIHMLKKPLLSHEKKEDYLNIVERRAIDLQDLLNNFFLLSVIKTPEYKIKLEPINLKELLCDIIISFYEQFISKGIEPEIHISEENIVILGDTCAIKRIIENLMINILKYCNGNNIIRLEKISNKAVLIIINPANNIKKEEANLIFDKFHKGDKSRGLNKESTGLGLTIVKELVEKLNGTITGEVNEGMLSIKCELPIYK